MRLRSFTGWPVLAALVLGGCGIDEYARMLIKQNTSYGKINEAMMGTSEQLVKQGRIFAGRRYTMPDKVEIDVWVLKASPSVPTRGTILIIHGLCDSKVTYLRLAKMLTEKGFDIVLPDLRAHGRSTGKYVTYGALEKHDQKGAIEALLSEKIITEPIYAMGVSLGGAVAIQYADIDPRVKGVMAMAAPKDLASVGRGFINSISPFMSDEDFEKVLVRAGQIGKFDPAEASALDAIARLSCPVLLVHGKLDGIVPYANSEALKQAARGPVELETLSLLGHIGMLFGREANIVENLERLVDGQIGRAKPPATE